MVVHVLNVRHLIALRLPLFDLAVADFMPKLCAPKTTTKITVHTHLLAGYFENNGGLSITVEIFSYKGSSDCGYQSSTQNKQTSQSAKQSQQVKQTNQVKLDAMHNDTNQMTDDTGKYILIDPTISELTIFSSTSYWTFAQSWSGYVFEFFNLQIHPPVHNSDKKFCEIRVNGVTIRHPFRKKSNLSLLGTVTIRHRGV